jgi:hypothetical protein
MGSGLLAHPGAHGAGFWPRRRDDVEMAPRPLESKAQFIARLRTQAKSLAKRHVGLGQHHWSHGVVLEEGMYRVRRLVLPKEKADAYIKEHRSFMPEHAEMLSEPTGAIVLEAPTLEGLIVKLEASNWPLV